MQMPGVNEFYGLLIACKDMRDIRLSCNPNSHSRRPMFDTLSKFAFPLTNKLVGLIVLNNYKKLFQPLYAFIHFTHSYSREKERRNGWELFDTRRELERQGIPNDEWVISDINNTYDFADTYPKYVSFKNWPLLQVPGRS